MSMLSYRKKRKLNPKIHLPNIAHISKFHPRFWGKSELKFLLTSVKLIQQG